MDIGQVRSSAGLLMPTPTLSPWAPSLMSLPGMGVLLRHKTTLRSDSSSQPVMNESVWSTLRLEEPWPHKQLLPPLACWGGIACAHNAHTHTHGTREARGGESTKEAGERSDYSTGGGGLR